MKTHVLIVRDKLLSAKCKIEIDDDDHWQCVKADPLLYWMLFADSDQLKRFYRHERLKFEWEKQTRKKRQIKTKSCWVCKSEVRGYQAYTAGEALCKACLARYSQAQYDNETVAQKRVRKPVKRSVKRKVKCLK